MTATHKTETLHLTVTMTDEPFEHTRKFANEKFWRGFLIASDQIPNIFEFTAIPIAPSTVAGHATLSDTLIVSGSTWNITSTNNGTVGNIAFTNIQNLVGGSDNDLFILSDGQGVTGMIDGGGGINTLDYSHYTTIAVVNLSAGTATNIGGGIRNIQLWITSPYDGLVIAAAQALSWADMTTIDVFNFGANGYFQPSPWDQKWIERTKGSVNIQQK